MYFLKDNTYTFGFHFMELYPNKEPFISQGLAGKPHIGTDLICQNNAGVATLSGFGTYSYGPQGGHTLTFVPNGRNHKIRFLHLKQKPKVGNIGVGDSVFITGNSGAATNAPHLHTDIFDNTTQQYINPETYNWTETPMVTQVKTTLYKKSINNPQVVSDGILILNNKIAVKTNAEFILSTEVLDTNKVFTTENYPMGQIAVKSSEILELDPRGGQVTCLVHNGILPAPTNPFHSPITSNGSTPIQIPENWYVTFPDVFAEFYFHELLHAWYFIADNLPTDQQIAKVHNPPPNWGGYGNSMDYYASLLLELKPYWPKIAAGAVGKKNSMFVTKDGQATIYLVESGVAIPFSTTFDVFKSYFPNAILLSVTSAEFAKLKTGLKIS